MKLTMVSMFVLLVGSEASAAVWEIKVKDLQTHETKTFNPPENKVFHFPASGKSAQDFVKISTGWFCSFTPAVRGMREFMCFPHQRSEQTVWVPVFDDSNSSTIRLCHSPPTTNDGKCLIFWLTGKK